MNAKRLTIVVVFALGFAQGGSLAASETVDYAKQIKPLLRERCFTCHGALKQRAGLRLDTVKLMIRGGDSGAVIAPGDPAASFLLQRVGATDPAERMPPEHEGEPFSAQQVKLVHDWIAAGALAPTNEEPEEDPQNHWAFRPITRPPVPTAGNARWIKNPIDAFLAQQHHRHGLVPQREAPSIILLRRLYLDLIGIPPAQQDISALERGNSPDWYERTVNRLLDDPRHGERWGRHWMDVWRYSDWWGLGAQLRRSQKHIWHWRDWIIESLNDDMPYDEMVRLMLAGDELYPNDLDKLRATGFLARNYWLFNRNQWMEETVEHVGKGFLGLTLNCAKCHDHKYDPIEQVDFYKMRAFFEPYHVRLDAVPGEPDLTRDGIPTIFDGWPDAPTYRFIRGQEKDPDKSVAIGAGVPEFVAFDELRIERIPLPRESWQPERRAWVIEGQLDKARESVRAAEAELRRRKMRQASHLTDREKGRQGEREGATQKEGETASEKQMEIAELGLAVARAELESVERRAAATRATWAAADEESDGDAAARDKTVYELAAAAVQAERLLAVSIARKSVLAAELELLKSAADKRPAAEKKLQSARDAVEKAQASAEAEIGANDNYSPFVGAKWTPTRFLFSARDDPAVKFVSHSTGRRTALANWITDRRNPLTARVAVNHIWTRHMGQPLVSTVFDFGRKGARPTNPELLDWLAAELMDSGWSMKHLHRLIVNSSAYRMSSSLADSGASRSADPENRYWWRRVPIRLESQLVRDSLLAHAGTLEETIGGPAVPQASQAASMRRSLYFFHSNNERNLFLTTFDEALVTECYRREQSIVPQQALALTNSRLVLDAVPQIAQRLSEQAADDVEFVRLAFATLLGIRASDEELAASQASLIAWQQQPGGSARSARRHLVWALINHNDFVTLR